MNLILTSCALQCQKQDQTAVWYRQSLDSSTTTRVQTAYSCMQRAEFLSAIKIKITSQSPVY